MKPGAGGYLLELRPGLHRAVDLLDLEQDGHTQQRAGGHHRLEVQEGVVSLVAIEESKPGKVGPTLCLHSDLQQCTIRVRIR